MLEDLDVVVCEADSAAPESCEQQKLGIDVGEVTEEQDRYGYRQNDDDTAHCRGALLLHLSLQSEVPDGLADLFLLQPSYNSASCEE